MDPIDRYSRLLQQIRSATKTDETDKARRTQDTPAGDKQSQAAKQKSIEAVRDQVRDRIRKMSPEDRNGRKAATTFVEAVMMWEFGEEVINDPGFDEITRKVVETICTEPNINKTLAEMVREMVG